MTLSQADLVWNRAAIEGGGAAPRMGDVALAALIAFHSITMNGGLDHALEFFSPDEVAASIRGFRFFGFNDVATMLECTGDVSPESEEEMDLQYSQLIPTDSVLVCAFESVFKSAPEIFAPVDGYAG